MGSRALFDSHTEEEIKNSLLDAKKQARRRLREECERAIAYMSNQQIEDTRGQLMDRYGKTQSAGGGQGMAPITIPLTERYIAEAADAYNRPVTRKLVLEDGETNEQIDKMTALLNEELEKCGYNDRLHHVDQVNNLIGSCGLWYQAKRGQLRPVMAYPHQIHEVAPNNGDFMDPADPEDYAGFAVEMHWAANDSTKPNAGSYAYVTPAEVAYYESSRGDPFEGIENLRTYVNPYRWPQVVDTEDQRGKLIDLPLQMMTLWHKRLPVGSVVLDVDSDIANANRELNIQLSVLFDTIRIQGWSVPVLKMLNANATPAKMAYGARFPLVLQVGEEASMLSTTAPYGEIIKALEALVKMLAIAHRQSSNDFSLDHTSAISGFAKLVDSLPKLEARRERIARLKHIEERIAWPRIAAIMKYLGKEGFTGDLSKVRLRVEFSDIEFPQSVDERTKQEDHDIKHGLTTPAKILAKRKGITVEQAEIEIEENRESNKASQPQAAPGLPGQPGAFGRGMGGGIGGLIGRKTSKQSQPEE